MWHACSVVLPMFPRTRLHDVILRALKIVIMHECTINKPRHLFTMEERTTNSIGDQARRKLLRGGAAIKIVSKASQKILAN